jgi:hypothetical protein
MSGAITPPLQYAFMAWCSVKAQGQLYLYLLTVLTSKFNFYNAVSSALIVTCFDVRNAVYQSLNRLPVGRRKSNITRADSNRSITNCSQNMRTVRVIRSELKVNLSCSVPTPITSRKVNLLINPCLPISI